jgi:hypothetical protein
MCEEMQGKYGKFMGDLMAKAYRPKQESTFSIPDFSL